MSTSPDVGLSPIFYEPDSMHVFPIRRRLADLPDGKIVIFGLQKAGSTWLLALLADTFDMPCFFNVQDSAKSATSGVVSTHDPFGPDIRGRRDFVHGVCLLRDLRDMVASYFHYMQTDSFQREVGLAKYPDIETFYYDWFLSRLVPAHRYHTYWEEYASRGVPILRFERLVQNTKGELIRLFQRWGESYDEARLEAAIEKNSFLSLKTHGKQMGSVKIEGSHFRSGQIGSYKHELPPRIIADINWRFSGLLRRWGYDVSTGSIL